MGNTFIPPDQMAKEIMQLIRKEADGDKKLEKQLLEATAQMFGAIPFNGH